MGNDCAKGGNKGINSKELKRQKTDELKSPISTMDPAPGMVQALKDPPQKPKVHYDRNKRLTKITEMSGESHSQANVNRSTINEISEDGEFMTVNDGQIENQLLESIHEPPAFNITPRAEQAKPQSLIETKVDQHQIVVSKNEN